mmetsp:Transcript_32989/g.97341  ORF Transcript_32989/g.97341 Transcript_32989/m.97341 type:complete len:181 (+) Transcript_32989:1681-2223(+)
MRPAVTLDGSFSKGRALRFLMRMHSGRLWSNTHFIFAIIFMYRLLWSPFFTIVTILLFGSFPPLMIPKTAAAIFGAPLVGYLTGSMIDETAEKGVASPEKANALAFNIFALSTLFWVLCCFFWLLMAYFVDSTTVSGSRNGKGGMEYAKLGQREEDEAETGVANNDAMTAGSGIELLRVA